MPRSFQSLKFILPMMLTSLSQQLYSMADLATAGRFAESTGTVGVSTGGKLNDIVLPFTTALASVGQIYLAQLYGAKKEVYMVNRRVIYANIS